MDEEPKREATRAPLIISILIASAGLLLLTTNPSITGLSVFSDNDPPSFGNGTFNRTSYNSSIGAVQLNLSYDSGTYTSGVFNVGGNATWNNISWTASTPQEETDKGYFSNSETKNYYSEVTYSVRHWYNVSGTLTGFSKLKVHAVLDCDGSCAGNVQARIGNATNWADHNFVDASTVRTDGTTTDYTWYTNTYNINLSALGNYFFVQLLLYTGSGTIRFLMDESGPAGPDAEFRSGSNGNGSQDGWINDNGDYAINITMISYTNTSTKARSCDDAACSGESWTDVYGAPPKDLTINNNTYFQYEFGFRTDSIGHTPLLYNVTIDYTLLGPTDNPPTTNLIAPADNHQTTNGTVTFECNASDDNQVTNITLYTNISAAWQANYTATADNLSYTISGITEGGYAWNCLAYDNASQAGWATNRTFNATRDTDNDGVPDDQDTLEGNESNVATSGVTDLNITIGGNSTNGTFSGTQEVVFYDATERLANFTHNFSAAKINLSKVSIAVTSNSILINLSGQLLPNEKKTLYIDDTNFISLCVKDSEIADISQMTNECNGTNETDFTSCIGNSTGIHINNISCADEGTRIRVDNLTYSAIRGTTPSQDQQPGGGGGGGGGSTECSNGLDDDGDGLTDMQDPGCESRSDNSEFNCEEDWECTDWRPCIDNQMTRTCRDLNNCGTSTGKPPAKKPCTSPPKQTSQPAEEGGATADVAEEMQGPEQPPETPAVEKPKKTTSGIIWSSIAANKDFAYLLAFSAIMITIAFTLRRPKQIKDLERQLYEDKRIKKDILTRTAELKKIEDKRQRVEEELLELETKRRQKMKKTLAKMQKMKEDLERPPWNKEK
jgi:hypothetical protein